jgi:hypothetical protein
MCGITYESATMFAYASNKDVCRFCHIITNINYGYNDEIELYWSQMSQADIITNTYKYYTQHKIMPRPIEIDNGLKLADISIVELIYLLKSQAANINNIIHNSNYKIFFTDKFDYNFVCASNDTRSCFDSDSDDDDDNNNNNNNQFNNYLNNNQTMPKPKPPPTLSLAPTKTQDKQEFRTIFSL